MSKLDLILNRQIKSCYVVAEIGQNHQGDLSVAKSMIQVAKECGADSVKFQKSNLEAKFTRSVLKRPYRHAHSFGETYGEHKQHLEFSVEEMRSLRDHCTEIGIDFGVSPMDPVSLQEMIALKPHFIKIGSGDANNYPLIREAARSEFPLIVSTGMQDQSVVDEIFEMLKDKSDCIIMHCVSSYPTRDNDVHLAQMVHMAKHNPERLVGYSGHEMGWYPSQAAVLLGANAVERHLTLDKDQKGSDHSSSLTPSEFSELIKSIRTIEANGMICTQLDEISNELFPLIAETEFIQYKRRLYGEIRMKKILYSCELECWNKLGKSLVYSRDMTCGMAITEKDIAVKVADRPGLQPQFIAAFIGNVLIQNVRYDESLNHDHYQQSLDDRHPAHIF